MRKPALCTLALAVALAGSARAQVSPQGIHHPTVGPGAGLSPSVSPTGGYSAAVPLDLPSPRAGLPVPLSIVYSGSSRAGAAGVGWEVPFWYVQRSTTALRRKPELTTDGSLRAASRIFLSLGGAPQLMVPRGNVHVPYLGDEYGELSEDGTGWKYKTLDNVIYQFRPWHELSPGTGAVDIWLLTSIRKVGNTEVVHIDYEAGCGRELNVSTISFTRDEHSKALYTIELDYVSWGDEGGTCRAFERVDGERLSYVRTQLLRSVLVKARNNLAPALGSKLIRSYSLDHQPDPDTRKPRLAAVQMSGEEGIPGSGPLPVAQYEYGFLTHDPTQPDGRREIRFGDPVEIPRPTALGDMGDDLATSEIETDEILGVVDTHPLAYVPNHRGRLETTRARHTMRDFTGDGVTDLLFLRNGYWSLYRGRLATQGVNFVSPPTLWLANNAEGPAEIHVQTTFRALEITSRQSHNLWARELAILTETWTSLIDWNGDGRLDVVDVKGGQDLDHWRVWINESAWNAAVRWRPIQVSVASVRAEMAARGIQRDSLANFPSLDSDNWLTLERTRSWRRLESRACTPYRCVLAGTGQGHLNCIEDEGEACDAPDSSYVDTAGLDSITDWALRDVNGDGFPDIALTGATARYCELNQNSGTSQQCGVHPSQQGDYYCAETHEEWVWGRNGCEFSSDDGEDVVFFNRTGPFTGVTPGPFGPPTPYELGNHGVEHWTDAGSDDPRDHDHHGFYHPDGLALQWRARGLHDRWGTGWLTPAGQQFAQDLFIVDMGFLSDQPGRCVDGAPPSTTYVSRHASGDLDVDGDGFLDRIRNGGRFNSYCDCYAGHSFTLVSPITDQSLSRATGTCGGPTKTVGAYTDMDGDGKPEALRIVDGKLMMSRMIPGGGENLHAVGRLVAITNGYGARTTITYANAKEDFVTNHMPFPEIVVRKTQTTVTDGSAPSLVPTFYSYGSPKLEYDPLMGHWAFSGYSKVISLTGELKEQDTMIDGILSVVRHAPSATPGASFEEHAAANRPASSYQSEVLYSLAQLTNPDHVGPSRFAGTTMRSAVATIVPPGTPSLECADLDPSTGQYAGFARCESAGIVYTAEVEAWEGLEGPPSHRNRMTRVSVLEVDAFGRATRVHDEGDVRSTADDLCTTTSYATPAGGGAFPTRPDTVVLTDCGYAPGGAAPGTPTFLSVLRLRYDGLPAGQVYEGRLTSRIVDRYDETGYRDTFELDARTYDASGELRTVTRARTLGTPATQTTTLTRDPFVASVVTISTSASDVPHTLTRTAGLSTWPSQPAVTTDANGIVARTEFDAFGRVVREISQGSDGTETTLSLTTYDDNPGGRVVATETFPAGATPSDESAATERGRRRTWLDALGRPRFSQSELGPDYHGLTMISGLAEYDAWGRAVYVAVPFEWPDELYVPEVDRDAHWGLTSVFDRRGRVVRSVEADGRNELALQTSRDTHIFVTSFEYAYLDGIARTYVRGPDENDPTSPRNGHRDLTFTNARGQTVERTRLDFAGTRLDLVRHRWDRLGRRIAIDRYVDPQTGNVPVSWSTSYDSLGRTLSMTEPGSATRFMTYDELGNPLESWWQDGVVRKISRTRYDGFGRPTDSTLVTETSGNEVVDAVDRFHYDTHSGSADQPAQPAMLGRLSWSETDDVGAVYHAYDAFGRSKSASYRYQGHDQLVRQLADYTVAGRLTGLTLETATTFDQIGYQYDSAGRVTQVLDARAGDPYWTAYPEFDGFYPEITLGNGVVETHRRDIKGRRYALGWEVHAQGEVWGHDYRERDALGRLTLEAHERPGETELRSHEFDSLGRLTATVELAYGLPRVETYTHDALGNITSRTATTSSGPRTFEYDTVDPDRLCRSAPGSTAGPCNFTYDAIGNVVSDVSHGSQQRYFKYDPAGRILRVDRDGHSATLTYGPAGRARTQINGVVDRDFWSFGGLIEEQHRGGDVQVERHIPGPLGIVATLRSNGYRDTTVYNHGDGRASRVFTDETGAVVQAPTFAAFGRVTQNNVSDPMTFTDDLWNGGDDIPELGVVLLGPRAYDPDLGRFLQRDPIAIVSRATTANPYAFAFSDPVNFADPTGLSPFGAIVQFFTAGAGTNSGGGGNGGGSSGWLANGLMNAAMSLLPVAGRAGSVPATAAGADAAQPFWHHTPFSPANSSKVLRNSISSARAACGWQCSARDTVVSLARRGWDHNVVYNPKAQREFMEGFVDAGYESAKATLGALERAADCRGDVYCVLTKSLEDAIASMPATFDAVASAGAAVREDPGSVFNMLDPHSGGQLAFAVAAAWVGGRVVPAPNSVVYQLVDDAGDVVYYGVSNNPMRRLAQHARQAPGPFKGMQIISKEVPLAQAQALETSLIRQASVEGRFVYNIAPQSISPSAPVFVPRTVIPDRTYLNPKIYKKGQ